MKIVVFFCMPNTNSHKKEIKKKSKSQLKNQIKNQIHNSKNKYLVINLNNEVNYFYHEIIKH